jgi:predicted transcriptional regulator
MSHDSDVIADAYITCRVTRDTKARVRALAEREGTNESAIVKRLIHEALGCSLLAEKAPADAQGNGRREQRVTVRMTIEDQRLLQERAAGRGITAGAYVAMLVRSHVLGRVPLPRAEHSILRQCVMELTAIGRNLDEIAGALDESGRATLPGRTAVADMMEIAVGLRDHFKQLLKENEDTWRNDVQTSH